MPVFSLPSKYGIGCFSKEAYEFIKQLQKAGQSYWQILPLDPIDANNSPYQSESTFAGNPFFIDLENLISHGLLTEKECSVLNDISSHSYIDYHSIRSMPSSVRPAARSSASILEAPLAITYSLILGSVPEGRTIREHPSSRS